MSWFARSIANSLRLDDTEDDSDHDQSDSTNNVEREIDKHHDQIVSPSSPSSQGRGVKDDLSEITKTLTRQFWGVASFLAPPPQSEPLPATRASNPEPREPSGTSGVADSEFSDSLRIAGIRSDFAEIGGKFKSGITKLSSNIGVSEFTKIASNFLQLGPEQEEYGSVGGGAVGVTEEVVAFVRDIAMHPETWLDFPLLDDEDEEEFDMSDAQQEHALAVERLTPRLTALRIELCPSYMSEDCFWKIYFVLLHPRLSQKDAELLSGPEIVKSRARLTQELQNRTNTKLEQDCLESDSTCTKELSNLQHEESLSVPSNTRLECVPHSLSSIRSPTSTKSADFETEKHPVLSNEIQIIDKSVIEEEPVNSTSSQILHSGSASRFLEDKYEDDGDDWLREENSEIVGDGVPIENEEDVSFSDLEEDDDDEGDVAVNYKKVMYGSDSSTKDSRDWVQLGQSSPDSLKDINTLTPDLAGSEQVSARSSVTKESNDWLNLSDIDVA